jgi:hypothetical protein
MIPAGNIANAEVRQFADEARAFVASHDWCARVTDVRLAWACAGVLGVFQVQLEPSRPGVDQRLWVVVGDLPTAYLVQDDASTWREALGAYVTEMSRWVDAVNQGDPLDDVIPVPIEPTQEHAKMLADRLAFIEQSILAAEAGEIESDA